MTQRPQHLLGRAARDRRVFFWEEPVFHAEGDLRDGQKSVNLLLELTDAAENLWVATPHLTFGTDALSAQRTLLEGLLRDARLSSFVRWYYTPMALAFSQDLPAVATVYDCMDELSLFRGAPPELVQWERKLLAAADVVFTGGLSLYEAKRGRHENVHAFPSSIDMSHFAAAKDLQRGADEPDDQRSLPHPRAGFYGVVDERFDTNLLRELAALRSNLHFVILGPVVKINPAELPQAHNIHYLGSKSYDELPAYLAGWDVALLLFARNEATRFISPTKTPEYLAAGKPVVSTSIRDVVREYGEPGLVAIADAPPAFAQALDAALEKPSSTWERAVAHKLSQGSWDRTWLAMSQEIDRAIETKQQGEPSRDADGLTDVAESEYGAEGASHRVAPQLASMRTSDGVADAGRSVTSPALRRSEHFDYIVAGAGFAGSVLAERLASQLGQRVLVVDRRDHIAGNAYDHVDASGVLVHKYGPHIFHTNSEPVLRYLSQFTAWRPYEHRVLSSVDGKLLPIPINLDTMNQLYNLSLDASSMESFLAAQAIVPAMIRTSEDIVVSRVGRDLYEKFFRNYTRKQWGLDPSELDASVAGRIPVRFNQDDRYFSDAFQVMPLDGYTRMFEHMLDHRNIKVRTGVEFSDVAKSYPGARIIFTGPIDEYFGFRYGPLPYRSLEFKHQTHNREVFQAAPVINYPNEHEYTRVTEFKYLTGQQHPATSIVYEYPRANGDPYYPIPRPENAALYARYKLLADADTRAVFCGRLANYRYFNMDQVVAQALTTFRELALSKRTPAKPVVGVSVLAAAESTELA